MVCGHVEEKGRYFKSTWHGCCVISRDGHGYRLAAVFFSGSGLKNPYELWSDSESSQI